MPMTEFSDDKPAPAGFEDVGELEPIENLLGGDRRRGDGGRDGGRRRRDR